MKSTISDIKRKFTVVEICAGAGGQALGLEAAGFEHIALVEIDSHCCNTLRLNRPEWNVIHQDVKDFEGHSYSGKVDLLAGGIPCPPFSVAGKQLGRADERNLVPELLRLTREMSPQVVLLENVPGLMQSRFDEYRGEINKAFANIGFRCVWNKLTSSDFGVSQLRPRAVMVAINELIRNDIVWPEHMGDAPPTVGELLGSMMAEAGWGGAEDWAKHANKIAPTIVGGSKRHGGPDLGPTRAKKAWAELGVNGKLIANEPPHKDFEGQPYLTVPMAARIQGFPLEWRFSGKKTPAYRQVGNAFPPPVAKAVGQAIIKILLEERKHQELLAKNYGKTISQRQVASVFS
jgi:DNA (cytosine-5)-methyltransferase 1